ncbi:MAG: glycosyltransferase family 39 protein [Candidatus Bathyarchaeota archaeon]|nr:glycosyltransferase family 39 protein [Candidatus Bathyarchaeota archaeon]
MANTNSLVTLGLYTGVGLVGFTLVFLFKKDLNLLSCPKKVVAACFLAAIIVGVCVFTFLNFSSNEANYLFLHDGTIYKELGQSFLKNTEFIELNGAYNHHAGPIFPLYLSQFYLFLQPHYGTQVALEIIFIVSLLVTFFATKKLYGLTAGLITSALVSTVPMYIFATSRNYAEPLILIFYILTLYFIVESLKPENECYIIFAGLTGVLGFLTKPSVGYFFILVGVIGLLWRYHYVGWKAFKNKNYLLALGVFLSITFVWTARNIVRFWDGTVLGLFTAAFPSNYMGQVTVFNVNNLGNFFVEVIFFSAFSAIFLSAYSWVFVGSLKTSLRYLREEKNSFLLIAMILSIMVGIFSSSLFYNLETTAEQAISYLPDYQARYFNLNTTRYLFVALIPLSWLAFEGQKTKHNLK